MEIQASCLEDIPNEDVEIPDGKKQGPKPEFRTSLVRRAPGEGRRMILVKWVGVSRAPRIQHGWRRKEQVEGSVRMDGSEGAELASSSGCRRRCEFTGREWPCR